MAKIHVIPPQDGIDDDDQDFYGWAPSQGSSSLALAKDPVAGAFVALTVWPNFNRLGYLTLKRLNSDGTTTRMRLLTTDHPDGG